MLKLGIVMDDLAAIKPYKDSSFAMLIEAQQRGYEIYYMQLQDLYVENAKAMALTQSVQLFDRAQDYYQFLSPPQVTALVELDVILMRKDPPFDMEYIYATYILELAEQEANGPLIVNKPQSLRDANEKMYTLKFASCIVPSLVSRSHKQIKSFINEHKDIIIKPLGGMGGSSIFRVQQHDPNTNVIIETLTKHGREFTMVQRFIPEITAGDKRILLIDGHPVDYALARIPAAGENRGNIAAGGTGKGVALNKRDYWLCDQIKDDLRAKGLIFVGIDVIGDYITEINVTSPTCIRELDSQFNLNISGELMDVIETKCAKPE